MSNEVLRGESSNVVDLDNSDIAESSRESEVGTVVLNKSGLNQNLHDELEISPVALLVTFLSKRRSIVTIGYLLAILNMSSPFIVMPHIASI
jgi:hypothetical protein